MTTLSEVAPKSIISAIFLVGPKNFKAIQAGLTNQPDISDFFTDTPLREALSVDDIGNYVLMELCNPVWYVHQSQTQYKNEKPKPLLHCHQPSKKWPRHSTSPDALQHLPPRKTLKT